MPKPVAPAPPTVDPVAALRREYEKCAAFVKKLNRNDPLFLVMMERKRKASIALNAALNQ